MGVLMLPDRIILIYIMSWMGVTYYSSSRFLHALKVELFVQIELFYALYGERVLIVAHSWGDNVARGFLAWMEEVHPGWVDKYVAVHFNAAGPTLGVPKALPALLSGSPASVAFRFAHQRCFQVRPPA